MNHLQIPITITGTENVPKTQQEIAESLAELAETLEQSRARLMKWGALVDEQARDLNRYLRWLADETKPRVRRRRLLLEIRFRQWQLSRTERKIRRKQASTGTERPLQPRR